jgi:hypothetical protein
MSYFLFLFQVGLTDVVTTAVVAFSVLAAHFFSVLLLLVALTAFLLLLLSLSLLLASLFSLSLLLLSTLSSLFDHTKIQRSKERYFTLFPVSGKT